jgi:uncharacterized membrane protein
MSFDFYKVLHLIAIMMLFAGYGSLLSPDSRKKGMMWHGIGLLILLISGFGMIAKMGNKELYHAPWIMIKMGLWLVLGFLPVLAKKSILSNATVLKLALLLGALIAYVGHYKSLPFN